MVAATASAIGKSPVVQAAETGVPSAALQAEAEGKPGQAASVDPPACGGVVVVEEEAVGVAGNPESTRECL